MKSPTSDNASDKPNAEAKLAWTLLRQGSLREAKVAPTNAHGNIRTTATFADAF